MSRSGGFLSISHSASGAGFPRWNPARRWRPAPGTAPRRPRRSRTRRRSGAPSLRDVENRPDDKAVNLVERELADELPVDFQQVDPATPSGRRSRRTRAEVVERDPAAERAQLLANLARLRRGSRSRRPRRARTRDRQGRRPRRELLGDVVDQSRLGDRLGGEVDRQPRPGRPPRASPPARSPTGRRRACSRTGRRLEELVRGDQLPRVSERMRIEQLVHHGLAGLQVDDRLRVQLEAVGARAPRAAAGTRSALEHVLARVRRVDGDAVAPASAWRRRARCRRSTSASSADAVSR